MTERCLIVGGGLTGLLTARQLRSQGYDVTVIEQGRTGRESSWAAGGILSPMYPWQYPDAITALYHYSAKHYPHLANELAEESRIDPEWVQSGILYLDTSGQGRVLQWAAKNKVTAEILSAGGTISGEPHVMRFDESAVWFPEIAQIRPPRLMKALRKSVDKRGVMVLEKTEVTGLLIENDRAIGVETAQGPLFGDVVVIAGGAWSEPLLDSVGLSAGIEPVRGQMILFKSHPKRLNRIVLYKERYLIPRRDGRILAGSTVEYAGFDKQTTRNGMESLYESALEIMPHLSQCKLECSWAGLRPGKKDGLPFIGHHPYIERLFVNTGHYRSGIALAPASATLLVNLILNQPPIVNPAPFLPH